MFSKLKSLYDQAIIASEHPSEFREDYHWFTHTGTGEWLGVPKNGLKEEELNLLQALFQYHEQPIPVYHNAAAERWYNYLFKRGAFPALKDQLVRFIQFEYSETELDRRELESALKGFFSEDIIIMWNQERKGTVVEEKIDRFIDDEDFLSVVSTLESDFFIKLYFYIGKLRPLTDGLPEYFRHEKMFFDEGVKLLPAERVLSFEKVFPTLLSSRMPEDIRNSLMEELRGILEDDPDLLATIKVFLENNLNVSLTAKKLYIHRNTLQYRLDKFSEKTGINLKDFNGAVTVYIACLLQDRN